MKASRVPIACCVSNSLQFQYATGADGLNLAESITRKLLKMQRCQIHCKPGSEPMARVLHQVIEQRSHLRDAAKYNSRCWRRTGSGFPVQACATCNRGQRPSEVMAKHSEKQIPRLVYFHKKYA